MKGFQRYTRRNNKTYKRFRRFDTQLNVPKRSLARPFFYGVATGVGLTFLDMMYLNKSEGGIAKTVKGGLQMISVLPKTECNCGPECKHEKVVERTTPKSERRDTGEKVGKTASSGHSHHGQGGTDRKEQGATAQEKRDARREGERKEAERRDGKTDNRDTTEKIKDAANRAGEKVKETAHNAKEKVKEGVNNVKEKAKETGEKAKEGARDAKEKAKETGERAKEKASETGDKVKEKAREGKEKAKEGKDRAERKVKEGADKADEKLKKAGKSVSSDSGVDDGEEREHKKRKNKREAGGKATGKSCKCKGDCKCRQCSSGGCCCCGKNGGEEPATIIYVYNVQCGCGSECKGKCKKGAHVKKGKSNSNKDENCDECNDEKGGEHSGHGSHSNEKKEGDQKKQSGKGNH